MAPLLDREEYIEQAYFFRIFRERVEEKVPSQEILAHIQEEILATTRLPMAIDFLKSEILLTGGISDGMKRLQHYFTPFQAFIIERGEDDRSKFDVRIGLTILEREAEYRAESPTMAGSFVYQFECLARNRLGYDAGMAAMAADPIFDKVWNRFVMRLRLQLGTLDLADVLYFHSEQFAEDQKRRNQDPPPDESLLFGSKEGRIARANQGRDPLYMFAALQRQLGYPAVPRPERKSSEADIHPALEQRLIRMEKRIKLLEMEAKGGLDLSQFYNPDEPPKFTDDEV